MSAREAIEALREEAKEAAPAIVKIINAAKFIAPQFVREVYGEDHFGWDGS